MPQSDSLRQVTQVLGRPLLRLELEKIHANRSASRTTKGALTVVRPPNEIDRAGERKRQFDRDPTRHTFAED